MSTEKDIKHEVAESIFREDTLGQVVAVEPTPEEDRAVLRKLDFIMMPLMGIAYFLQFLDKLAISQATLFNMRQDLHLVKDQYSWASAIFYFGYFAWSWPSSYIIVRLPIGKYLATSVILWGGILMCHAACTSFAGIITVRFFLGVGEAAVAPGFALITGMFFKREEQPIRQAAWYFGNCSAFLLGGLISYGIGHIDSHSFPTWKLLFLIFGAITCAYGFVLFLLLPDSPMKAIFLKRHERVIAVHRTLKNKTGVLDTGVFKWSQARDALTDPQVWCLALSTFCYSLANGGITTFAPLIIAGFGFTNFQALLMQMPQGGSEIFFLILICLVATYIPRSRVLAMFFTMMVSVIGMALVWKLNDHDKVGRMVGITLGIAYAVNLPISLSVVTSNVAGFTKKSVCSAMIFTGYCLGNIIGPQFFLTSQEPTYQMGISAAMAGLALSAFFLLLLYFYYVYENRRRDRLYGLAEAISDSAELQDEISNKTDREITSFRYLL